MIIFFMQNFALFCELKMKKGAKNHCSSGLYIAIFQYFETFSLEKDV